MGKLYVVFRGSWTFVQVQTGEVYVKTPDIGPDHVYRAGDFGSEQDFMPGSLHRLVGVAQPLKHYDILLNNADQFCFMNARFASTTECGSRTTLVLPPPASIDCLHQIDIPRNRLVVRKGQIEPGGADPVVSSLIHVLGYEYKDPRLVALEGFAWVPAEVNGVATLHFRVEPTGGVHSGHTARAFRMTSLLLGGDVTVDPVGIGPPVLRRPIPRDLKDREHEVMPTPGGLNPGPHPHDRSADGPEIPETPHESSDFDGPVALLDNPTCLPNWGDGECP